MRAQLRQVCCELRQLADSQLPATLSLVLDVLELHNSISGQLDYASKKAVKDPAEHALQGMCSLLARPEAQHVTGLRLRVEAKQEHARVVLAAPQLGHIIKRLGIATSGRIRRLRLQAHASVHCDPGVVEAISSAFPLLEELRMQLAWGDAWGGASVLQGSKQAWSDAVRCLPASLHTLELNFWVAPCNPLLAVLGAASQLTKLHTLHVRPANTDARGQAPEPDPPGLPPWLTVASSLTDLHLWHAMEQPVQDLASILQACTGLRSLAINTPHSGLPGIAAHGGAHLTKLQFLQSEAWVDEAGVAGIAALPCLQHLAIGDDRLLRPFTATRADSMPALPAGLLSNLQTFEIAGSVDLTACALQLLLKSGVVARTCRVVLGDHVFVNMGCLSQGTGAFLASELVGRVGYRHPASSGAVEWGVLPLGITQPYDDDQVSLGQGSSAAQGMGHLANALAGIRPRRDFADDLQYHMTAGSWQGQATQHMETLVLDVSVKEEMDVLRSVRPAVQSGCLANLKTLVLLGASSLVPGALDTWVAPLLRPGVLGEVQLHAGGGQAPWCGSELLVRGAARDARRGVGEPDRLVLVQGA